MTGKDRRRDSPHVSDCLDMYTEHPCDMILRIEEDTLTPAIFFNKDLPDVLACISKEINALYTQQRLAKRMCGLSNANISGPLGSWYKCILDDIYKDESPADNVLSEIRIPDLSDRRTPVSFCLEGEIFAPIPYSSFFFVTLRLPPLWQQMREQYFKAALSVCPPGKTTVRNPNSRLFRFCYYPEPGLWYTALSGSSRKLRLLIKH